VADASDALPAADPPTPNRPKPDYAGAQEIVSNPPHSTKGVQTIRRPDLVAPPKLAYPIRLPSMVMLPAPAIPAPIPAQPGQPKPAKSDEVATVRPSESPVQLPMRAKVQNVSAVRPEGVVPKTIPASEPSFAPTASPEVSAPKAVVVISAVSVPPEPAPLIPDAELASRFVVAPSTDATSENTASGSTGGTTASANASNKAKDSSRPTAENRPESSVAASPGAKGRAASEGSGAIAGVANSGSPSNNTAVRPAGNSAPTDAAKTGLAGISISGGVSGRGGRLAAINPIPHGSYGLTVISGGSSGGASRDLGVFSRGEIVYTVYIPMADAGGGPDWPMQYALASSGPAHNGSLDGLLTPPVVQKKIQATAPKTDLTANSGPVLVTGIIDENGKLQALRAIRALDGRAQCAMDALAQWEFLPGQLDGKPVASKVLIGVSVMPAEEVGKQN